MKIFLITFLPFIVFNTANANHFFVLESVSKPEIQIGDLPKAVLMKKTEIHTDFKIKTLKDQFAKFKLGQNIEVSVFPETDVVFLVKDSKLSSGGFVIKLMSGQIYVNKKSESILDIKSEFFDWSLNKDQNMNLVIKHDLNAANIEFCNREKPFEVFLFDHEKKISLAAAESIQFQGLIENQKLAFDILLNQRKIPKGQWQNIKKCSFSDIEVQEKKLFQIEAAELNKVKSNIQKIKNKKIADDSKYLCHKPYGQLNDCLWQKTDGKCVRNRCNAEGLWADSQVVSAEKSSQCNSKPVVSACDY